MKTLKIKVEGAVQGVFFRQTAKEEADKLRLKGVVKNCEDTSVEIIATGEEEPLKQLIEWCKEGPPRAKVENLVIQELPLQQFRNFSVAYF